MVTTVEGEAHMASLASLADGYLEISSRDSLSPRVIDRVNKACERVEDAPKDVILLVRLHDGRAASDDAASAAGDDAASEDVAGGEPWPHEVGIHAVNRWERALRRLERLPGATLAVVEGDCTGLALEMLLTTDCRVALDTARFRLPATAEGTWPGMSLYRLANQVGVAQIRRSVLFGLDFDAVRAAELGLIDQIGEDPAALARAALEMLGGGRGTELAIRRRLLLDATTTSFEDALGSHLAACDRALRLAQRGLDAGAGL
jgi:isomerase DpgB